MHFFTHTYPFQVSTSDRGVTCDRQPSSPTDGLEQEQPAKEGGRNTNSHRDRTWTKRWRTNRHHCRFTGEGRGLQKGQGSLKTSQARKQVQDEVANMSPNTPRLCVPAGVTSAPGLTPGLQSQCM